jgi:hypothetical protein
MFAAHAAKAAAASTNDRPTQENALEAETELGQAMRTNDADGFCRLVNWAVVNGIGGFDESVGVRDRVCAAIKAGTFTRKTYEMDLANARVRVLRQHRNHNLSSLAFGLFGA